jgi:hypothetical protein
MARKQSYHKRFAFVLSRKKDGRFTRSNPTSSRILQVMSIWLTYNFVITPKINHIFVSLPHLQSIEREEKYSRYSSDYGCRCAF